MDDMEQAMTPDDLRRAIAEAKGMTELSGVEPTGRMTALHPLSCIDRIPVPDWPTDPAAAMGLFAELPEGTTLERDHDGDDETWWVDDDPCHFYQATGPTFCIAISRAWLKWHQAKEQP